MNDATPLRAVGAATASVIAFLRQHPPFNAMEAEELGRVTAKLSVAYYPKGATVVDPGQGQPRFLYIVHRGTVRRNPVEGDNGVSAGVLELGAGECFSVGALIERRPVSAVYTAATDAFCFLLGEQEFQGLLHRSAPFQDFATKYLTSLLAESRRMLGIEHSSSAGELQAMNRSLESMIRRAPVTCGPGTPIRDALRAMQREKTGSIVVVGEDGSPVGIFTRHDVLDRVALASADTGRPIASIMTKPPRTIDSDATAYDAALEMARWGIRHLPVLTEGRVAGVVTERDLFALQRVSIRHINRTVSDAEDVPELRQAVADIRRLATDMIRQGVAAAQLTRIVSTLNDAVTRRVIDLEARRHDLAGIEWCWIAFGSEGRIEQTLASDQDNGLIFSTEADAPAETTRRRLLPFAQAINSALDACGFPLCGGGIMAGNPRWCLDEREWAEQFSRWVRDPLPEALLHSTIFFDLRALHGSASLVHALQRHLLEMVHGNSLFLRAMAQQALEVSPPLGLLRDFVAAEEGEHAGTLDLKHRGTRLFVDAARVIALAAGISQANTEQRLRLGGARLQIAEAETDAVIEAFHFLLHLRLRAGAGSNANHVAPDALNEVDRRILKEAFRQARKLQSRLALDYQL